MNGSYVLVEGVTHYHVEIFEGLEQPSLGGGLISYPMCVNYKYNHM